MQTIKIFIQNLSFIDSLNKSREYVFLFSAIAALLKLTLHKE